jgi:hypothetical protein
MPHEMICHLKEKRVVMLGELLELLQIEETFGFARVVTRNDSWLYLNYSHPRLWLVSDDERLVRVDQTITNEKQMLTVLWSIKALMVIEWLGPGDIFDTTCFCEVTIAKFVQALYSGGSFRGDENFHCIWIMVVFAIVQGQLNLLTRSNSSDYATRHIRRM